MNSSENSANPYDAFTKFWSDMTGRMAAAGVQQPFATQDGDNVKRVQRAFFEAWAQYCDEFMRSPAFLEAMKKSMENSIALREQLNKFLTKTMQDFQIPSRVDTDAITELLHGIEDRLADRLDTVNERIDKLESQLNRQARKTGPTKGA